MGALASFWSKSPFNKIIMFRLFSCLFSCFLSNQVNGADVKKKNYVKITKSRRHA